jgi:phosphatidylglycerophosphatase A
MFKFCEFILTFGYLGNIKKAPGTFGSIGGVIFWLILTKFFFLANFTVFFQNFLWLLIIAISTIFACQKIKFYTDNFTEKKSKKNHLSKNLANNKNHKIDNHTIVLDEVVGQIIALQIGLNFITENYFLDFKILIIHLVLSLTLFRLFDIKKPWIIGIADSKINNAFGVMFDDILAGIFAGAIAWIALSYVM